MHWSARPPAGPFRAGAQFDVKMEAAIDGNWHMYSTTTPPGGPIPTRFYSALGRTLQHLRERFDNLRRKTEFDPNFGIQTEIYAGGAEFWIPLRVAVSAKPGEYEVRLQAYYQVCDDKSCLPPRGVPVSFTDPISRRNCLSFRNGRREHGTGRVAAGGGSGIRRRAGAAPPREPRRKFRRHGPEDFSLSSGWR